jgi:hypothetical protein
MAVSRGGGERRGDVLKTGVAKAVDDDGGGSRYYR